LIKKIHKKEYSDAMRIIGFLADVNEPFYSSGHRHTAIAAAVQEEHLEIAKALLDKGADIEARSKPGGFTPLEFAAQFGRPDTVRLLLSRGADPNARDDHSGTALHCAALDAHINIAEILLDGGSHPPPAPTERSERNYREL
jgi:ankyrin repeat protein